MPDHIFVIGAARSGTKFLRDVLAASQHVDAVPYDINYVWRYGNENAADDELTVGNLSEPIKAYIQATVDQQARTGKSDASTVIEKTVSNTLRLGFVKAVFPEARFIHLIRDGRDVTESARRQWEKPSDWSYLVEKIKTFPWRNYRYLLWFLKGKLQARSNGRPPIWGPRYKGIERDVVDHSLVRVCARQWKRSIEAVVEQKSCIDDDRFIEIRYEDLVNDESVLKGVCEFCEIPDAQLVLNRFQEVRLAGLGGQWRERLNEDEITEMMAELQDVLIQTGYRE